MRLKSLLLSGALLTTAIANAQTANWTIDTLSVGAGYATNVYYNLENSNKVLAPANN